MYAFYLFLISAQIFSLSDSTDLVIETTGLADPIFVQSFFLNNSFRENLRLDGIITVVGTSKVFDIYFHGITTVRTCNIIPIEYALMAIPDARHITAHLDDASRERTEAQEQMYASPLPSS